MASTISHCRLSVAEHSYRARRASERAERIERARQNLAHAQAEAPVLAASARPAADRSVRSFGSALVVVMGSQLVIAYAGLCSAAAPSQHIDIPRKIQVVMAPVQKPVPELPPVESAKPPVTPPVAVAKPRSVPKTEPKAPPAEVTPKTEVAPAPLPIVGLTLESTSSSGQGAVFAVGQTLSGTTARVAADAETLERNPEPAQTAPVQPKRSRNQLAGPRAEAGVKVEPARRLSRVEPVYPALLGRQNLEADVTVRVSIGKDGALLSADIVRGAEQAEFNQAALVAAKQERFAPETHDGAPVQTSLTYTYRFRITP